MILNWPPKNYKPLWHQYDFHKNKSTYKWLCSGIGGGKSLVAIIEDYSWAVLNPGCTGAIVVPDFRTWKHVLKPLCEEWWPKGTWDEDKSYHEIKIKAGKQTSKILIYSAHNSQHVEKILGTNLSFFHMEETGRMLQGERAWRNVTGRLREKKVKRRGGWIASSPTGFNWLTDAFGIDEELPSTAYKYGLITKKEVFKNPDTGNETTTTYWVRGAQTNWNTNNPEEYYANLLATYGGDKRFVDQEIYGRILTQADLILHNFSKYIHVVSHEDALRIFSKCHYKHGGVDWGDRVGAVTWGGTTADGWEGGTIVTIGELYQPEQDAESMGALAHELNKTIGPFRWYCDPEDPGSIRKWRYGFNHAGTYYDPVEGVQIPSNIKGRKWNQWKPGIDLIRNYLCFDSTTKNPVNSTKGSPRFFISERCRNLIKEIKNYKWAIRPENTGLREYRENAIGEHHAIDTLRYRLLGEMILTSSKLNIYSA